MSALAPHDGGIRLMVVATSHETLASFFIRQLEFLTSEGFRVLAVASPGVGLDALAAIPGVAVHGLPMQRKPHPVHDLISLVRLCRLTARYRPHIVHAHTPKAGLLGMLASALARVPVRLYTIHGLPLLTRAGWRRYILASAERLACALSSRTYCVSPSMAALVRQMNLCPERKLFTPGAGSCAGVDPGRFHPRGAAALRRDLFREAHGIPRDAVLLCYVGRVARDKGIEVLAAAWNDLAARFPRLHLLLCGACDPTDPVADSVLSALRGDPRVHLTDGWVEAREMPAVYAASDVCVLPTFREGLSQVALECGAMEIPLVGTRIPGLVSAVRDGVTALLVPPGEPQPLQDAIAALLRDEPLRRRLGTAGRRFVTAQFSEMRVNRSYLDEYRSLLAPAGFARSTAGISL